MAAWAAPSDDACFSTVQAAVLNCIASVVSEISVSFKACYHFLVRGLSRDRAFGAPARSCALVLAALFTEAAYVLLQDVLFS